MAAVAERTLRSRATTKTIPDLTPEEFQACCTLTLAGFGGYGSMQPRLKKLRRAEDRDSFATFLKDDEGEIAGWALTFRDRMQVQWRNKGYNTYFFVHPEMRRRGIGTKLYRSVRRRFGIVRVHPWSEESRGFFGSVRATS